MYPISGVAEAFFTEGSEKKNVHEIRKTSSTVCMVAACIIPNVCMYYPGIQYLRAPDPLSLQCLFGGTPHQPPTDRGSTDGDYFSE